MDRTIYFVSSGGGAYKEWMPVPSVSAVNEKKNTADIADMVYAKAIQEAGFEYQSVAVYYPADDSASYRVIVNPSAKTSYRSASFYYDQRTGQRVGEELPQKMNNGEYLRNMYYDIHVGKILGLPGQLLVFFAALIAASLPVTGFYIWWGKYKKKPKNIAAPLSRAQRNRDVSATGLEALQPDLYKK
jgi:uncharacterized iron-regulated membrane protein